MFKLTVMIDGAIRHQPDMFKSAVRKNRDDFLCEFPPLRVWLYVKILRDPDILMHRLPHAEHADLEDIFAEGIPSLNTYPMR